MLMGPLHPLRYKQQQGRIHSGAQCNLQLVVLGGGQTFHISSGHCEKCPYLQAAARMRPEQSPVVSRVRAHTRELCSLSPTGTLSIDSSYAYKEK